MPSFPRGHLLIYLPPSPVFRNSLQLALFGGVQRQSVCYRRRVLGLGLIWRLAGGRKTSSAEGRPATVNAGAIPVSIPITVSVPIAVRCTVAAPGSGTPRSAAPGGNVAVGSIRRNAVVPIHVLHSAFHAANLALIVGLTIALPARVITVKTLLIAC